MEKVEGLRIFKMRVRELSKHGEDISTPRACHEGQKPLIECARHDFKIMYFPFLCFLCIFPFIFFYLFGVDKSVAFAPTYPWV